MRRPSSARRLLAAIAATLCLAPVPALAQYPDKPIRLVVPWPAGGGTDVAARAVAAPLSERLKQPVVVDNRPGANGSIGTDVVARAPKDGYTLLMVTADTNAIGPHVYPKLPYDVRKDFDSVGMAGYFPYALVTSPNFSATTVADFVAYAKKNPGKITFASWGVGSSAHVGMEMLKQQAGIFMLHVPFQGAAPAVQAVAGSQVDAMVVPVAVAEPLARAGRLRMLGAQGTGHPGRCRHLAGHHGAGRHTARGAGHPEPRPECRPGDAVGPGSPAQDEHRALDHEHGEVQDLRRHRIRPLGQDRPRSEDQARLTPRRCAHPARES